VPEGVGPQTRVFRPGADVRLVAGVICERAWKVGVRVFRWPCGTVAVAIINGRGDVALLRDALPQLIGTYARDGRGVGPKVLDVIQALQWEARACTK
jgi:hypothetical protein